MLIVAGWLEVDAQDRDEYVAESAETVRQARTASGCLEFAISADTLDPARILVFERWESEAQLVAFRGSGPGDAQAGQIRAAGVARYEISAVRPA